MLRRPLRKARLSECLGLVWADFELDDVATAAVSFEFQVDREGRRQPLKTDESRRTVELPRPLAAMLVQHKLASLRSTPRDFVFASRSGRPLGQRNVLRALRRAQERAVDGRGRPTFPALHQRDERGRRLPPVPGALPPSTPSDTPRRATRSLPASPPRRCRGSSATATASSPGRSTSTNSRQPSEPRDVGSAWKMNPPGSCPRRAHHDQGNRCNRMRLSPWSQRRKPCGESSSPSIPTAGCTPVRRGQPDPRLDAPARRHSS
jgi:hypothetical protein